MSYAFVQDVPATWDTYRGIAETLVSELPGGTRAPRGRTDRRRISHDRDLGLAERCAIDFETSDWSKILESLTCGTRAQPTYRELQIAHLISADIGGTYQSRVVANAGLRPPNEARSGGS